VNEIEYDLVLLEKSIDRKEKHQNHATTLDGEKRACRLAKDVRNKADPLVIRCT